MRSRFRSFAVAVALPTANMASAATAPAIKVAFLICPPRRMLVSRERATGSRITHPDESPGGSQPGPEVPPLMLPSTSSRSPPSPPDPDPPPETPEPESLLDPGPDADPDPDSPLELEPGPGPGPELELWSSSPEPLCSEPSLPPPPGPEWPESPLPEESEP